MTTELSLEIFFERDGDQEFATKEKGKLELLVRSLIPHINLKIKVYKATKICPPKTEDDIPTHEPVEQGSQTLLITNEQFGPKERRANREGRSGPGKGCLSKKKLEEKGTKSADITIHEWLHTLQGKEIGGRKIPCVDSEEGHKFACRDVDGEKCWHYWYKYILRPPD